MYYQIEQVLEKQQFETENYYKGRGILVCETRQGLFALKEFHGQMQKAEYLYQLGEFLKKQNISCDYMVKNKEDQLLTEGVDGIRYSFHHWVKGRECDVRSRLDIVLTVSFLAKFHQVCEGQEKLFAEPVGAQGKIPEEAGEGQEKLMEEIGDGAGAIQTGPSVGASLYEECCRHDRELRRIRKYVLKRKNKSDFERLYLKCCGEYLKQSEDVLQFLSERQELLRHHTTGICHGDFNQHNVAMEAGEMTLVHMEHAFHGPQVSDLCNFLRKMLEKHEWSETLGLEMVREYNRIHRLNDADWLELYCRLSYPEKFWKIANHYFQSNKVWDSGKNHEKLQKELGQNTMRQRFLETLKRVKL